MNIERFIRLLLDAKRYCSFPQTENSYDFCSTSLYILAVRKDCIRKRIHLVFFLAFHLSSIFSCVLCNDKKFSPFSAAKINAESPFLSVALKLTPSVGCVLSKIIRTILSSSKKLMNKEIAFYWNALSDQEIELIFASN